MLGPHRPRARFRALVAAACTAALGAACSPARAPRPPPPRTPGRRRPHAARRPGLKVVGYFTEWGIYDRKYHVKNIETSGSAKKLTHINYAFGNVTGGKCAIGDSFADYREDLHRRTESVDGVADTWDQPLRGSFNQLRKLKKLHPNLKVLWSFGGWTWSGGFGEAAKNPAAFAQSCYDLVENSRWKDVFDGIDIDWEYPNACGLTCDTSGREAFKNLMSALRSKFGSSQPGHRGDHRRRHVRRQDRRGELRGRRPVRRLVQPDDVRLLRRLGRRRAHRPALPAAPPTPASRSRAFNTDAAIKKLKGLGIPSSKLLLGIGFYGRGWTGVTQSAPGGTATGPAAGTYEQGIEDYKVLKSKCPANGTVAGTAYAKCGNDWWSYDTPATIAGKMTYKNQQGLGGTFFWELSGDTSNGELIKAIN